MKTIIVLPDGETWNTIDGCSICTVTEEEFDKLCRDELGAGNLKPVSEIGLRSFYEPT